MERRCQPSGKKKKKEDFSAILIKLFYVCLCLCSMETGIKWGLKMTAVVIGFYWSKYGNATIPIVILSLFTYFFPTKILNGVRWCIVRRRIPQRKLISREEFVEQGRVETKKALMELREFINSSKYKDRWRLHLILSSPTRFVSFVNGDADVSRQEMSEHRKAY